MRTTDNFEDMPPRNSNKTNRPNRTTQRPSQRGIYDEPVRPRLKRSYVKVIPWYDSILANFLYLFLFAPVGVWRMLVNKRFTPMIKLVVSMISLTWFTILIILLFSNLGDVRQTNAPTATPIATVTPLAATETPTATNTPEQDDDSTNTVTSTTYYIKADGVRLRSAATTDSEIIATLNKGDIVTKIAIIEDWSQVTTTDKSGYIRSDLLSEDKN